MVQRVAIVGAGLSGLASIKCCLEEGLEPTCFEKSDGIGGIWKFTETPEEGRATVYRSVVTNTSKEMTSFSDFPFPEEWPNYLRHSAFLDYLKMYAEHFQLLHYIHFQTTVRCIRRHPSFATTGQWVVSSETKEGQESAAVFDAVMVCSGRFAERRLPLDSFPGIKNFKGRYLHSSEYIDQKGFEGKRVLVIGAGNSGGDIAAEISRVSAKVFFSTRSGTWVVSRISKAGWPLDMLFTTRFHRFVEWLLPTGVTRRMLAKKFNQWFSHENYGLTPLASTWTPLILNEELPSCILCGAVAVKPNVKAFTETSAVFEDGTVEENLDVVLFTTGFTPSFPFLEESVRPFCTTNTSLYKKIFPPHLEKPTLAVVGFLSINGSYGPAAELQARWVTRVFNGSSKLPPMSRQIREIAKQKEDLLKRGIPIENSRVNVSFVAYMDEIATCVGVKPNVPLIFLTDPKLAVQVFFGPCTAYQYRLAGPGKWGEARSTILTQWDRTLKPLKTRVINGPRKHSRVVHWLKVLAFAIFLGGTLLTFKDSLSL